MFLIIPFLIIALQLTEALDNGLALTPPMGWMHWQRFRCVTDCQAYPEDCVQEKLFREMADIISNNGYQEAGYEYVIVDDCWMRKTRDENGQLVADPDRFPSGMKALADFVHSKGLKFGIYADYGTLTCGGYPGSIEYLKQDANTFASWGVDYLKLDGCYSDVLTMEAGYSKMSQYLNETGRPIVYSCSWPAYQEPIGILPNYKKMAEVCNLWRNWDDIDDAWTNVTNILKWFGDNQHRLAPYAGPGHWNDPDMLIIGNFGLSLEQAKAQMALWAILAAPLIMSVDLRSIRPEFKEILQNPVVIEINQDRLGIQGLRQFTKDKIEFWMRSIEPQVEDVNSMAIALLSKRVDGYPYRVNFTLNDLNLTHSSNGYIVKNVYDNDKVQVQSMDTLFFRVKPSGTVLLKVIPVPSANVIEI